MAKLISNLGRIGRQAPEAARKALLQTAADIVVLTKALSPVDTGALRQSYGADPVSSSHVLIGSDKEYAPFVEYGTVNMGAQPHLTPAFVQAEETFKVRLQQEINKIIP